MSDPVAQRAEAAGYIWEYRDCGPGLSDADLAHALRFIEALPDRLLPALLRLLETKGVGELENMMLAVRIGLAPEWIDEAY